MENFIVISYEGMTVGEWKMTASIIEARGEENAWEIAQNYQSNSNTLHLLTIKEAEGLLDILKIIIAKTKL